MCLVSLDCELQVYFRSHHHFKFGRTDGLTDRCVRYNQTLKATVLLILHCALHGGWRDKSRSISIAISFTRLCKCPQSAIRGDYVPFASIRLREGPLSRPRTITIAEDFYQFTYWRGGHPRPAAARAPVLLRRQRHWRRGRRRSQRVFPKSFSAAAADGRRWGEAVAQVLFSNAAAVHHAATPARAAAAATNAAADAEATPAGPEPGAATAQTVVAHPAYGATRPPKGAAAGTAPVVVVPVSLQFR
jgi:hypothetical protein